MLDSCSLTNLLNKYTPHKFHNIKRLQDTINTYRDRVQMLCCEGEAEGIELHSPSEEDFYSFVKSAPFSGRASLVLIDNGNLRAVWRNDDGSHVGIQFRGGQTVSCVIFKRRSSASGISRVGRHGHIGRSQEPNSSFRLGTIVERMTCEDLTDDSHVVRYARPTLVREDGTVGGEAFQLRSSRGRLVRPLAGMF